MKRRSPASLVGPAVLASVVLSLVTSFAAFGCSDGSSSTCEDMRRRLAGRGVHAEAGCESDAERTAMSELASVTLAVAPEELPPDLVVRFESSAGATFRGPRVPARGREVFVDPRSPAARDPSIWLHEFAHVFARSDDAGVLAGPSVASTTTARLRRAVEEGLADYWAASIARSTKLGVVDGREVRDLARPVTVTDSEWAMLPFAHAPYDAHRLGHSLASLVYASRGFDVAFARAGLRALGRMAGATTLDTPASFVDALTAADAPFASDLRLLLSSWLPADWHSNVRPR